MGRSKSRATAHLPKSCYQQRGHVYYREYLGIVDGKRQYAKPIRLCSADKPASHIWRAYEAVTNRQTKRSLDWLLREYHHSVKFIERIKPRTQKDYEAYRRLMTNRRDQDGHRFGDALLRHIRPSTIQKYLVTYRDPQGNKAPIAANRHIQYLRAAWNHIRLFHDNLPENPCVGVEMNTEEGRGDEAYYVDDETLAKYKEVAASGHQPSFLPIAMELAYLCRLRLQEVYDIKHEDILEYGLRVKRSKGSRGEITVWTPRLRAAVNAALAWQPQAPVPGTGAYLIHTKTGGKVSVSNHKSQWQRLQQKIDKAGIRRVTFHDLKAKGYTDQREQDAGHRSGKMHNTYNRRARLVVPPEDGTLKLPDDISKTPKI